MAEKPTEKELCLEDQTSSKNTQSTELDSLLDGKYCNIYFLFSLFYDYIRKFLFCYCILD